MKIAIVGTGISGLTCAYLLNHKYKLTIFEKNNYVGGHTHTHSINNNGKIIPVDSGFIVYNEKTYPNFIKLLDKLKVTRQKTTMGFSIKSANKNLEYAGNSINSIFAQRINIIRPSFIKMIIEILIFNKKATNDLNKLNLDITLGKYLSNNNFSKKFIDNYIIPMGAAIWSTKAESILKFPAKFFIQFFYNHSLLKIKNRSDWWVIKGGSKQYINKLIKKFEHKIRLNTSVQSIRRSNGKIYIKNNTKNKEELFDAVIIATHSDQGLQMLSDPSEDEQEILGAIPYQKNKALLHTDISLLPKRKLAWASWNYNLDHSLNKPVTLTYNMNILQTLNELETYCVSLNNIEKIDENKILKKINYEHPLFTSAGIESQKRKYKISGINNTFYCGAYWHNGFHEDGVVSALDVCKHFGVSL